MVKRYTKLRVFFQEEIDTEIVQVILKNLRERYDIHFCSVYIYENKNTLYFQSTAKSVMVPTMVKAICKKYITVFGIESFDEILGDQIETIEPIGSLRKRGYRGDETQRKKKGKKNTDGNVNITNNNNNNNTTNNITNNVFNIQIVLPNGVGEESLSHVTAEDLDQIMRALDSKKFPTILDVEIYLRVLAKFANVLIRDIKNCNVKGRQNDALYKYVSPGGVWLHERKSFGFVHRVHDNWVNHLKTCFEEHKGDMSPEYLESFERCNEMLMELRKRGDERYERVAITEGTAIMGNMAERVKFGEKHENLKLDGY